MNLRGGRFRVRFLFREAVAGVTGRIDKSSVRRKAGRAKAHVDSFLYLLGLMSKVFNTEEYLNNSGVASYVALWADRCIWNLLYPQSHRAAANHLTLLIQVHASRAHG